MNKVRIQPKDAQAALTAIYAKAGTAGHKPNKSWKQDRKNKMARIKFENGEDR